MYDKSSSNYLDYLSNKEQNLCCRNSWKSNANKESKEMQKDNFCYYKLVRAITLLEAIEKSPIFRILGEPLLFSPTNRIKEDEMKRKHWKN